MIKHNETFHNPGRQAEKKELRLELNMKRFMFEQDETGGRCGSGYGMPMTAGGRRISYKYAVFEEVEEKNGHGSRENFMQI